MNRIRGVRRPRTSTRTAIAAVGAAVLALTVLPASQAALSDSDFEILDGNLRLDTTGNLDWAVVDETRQPDKPSGSGDDSFGQGTKEDTPVPTVVDGSIPPNKSDLKNFGVHLETSTAGARFLHLFWHRVQDPSGTTNMDFEFNQSETVSGNGITPARSSGDLLIQYDLANGGTNPELFLSRWLAVGDPGLCEASNTKPCWGDRVDLSGADLADGSINTVAIPAAEADGLGAVSARTFGEATIDFDALTGGTDRCVSFGSAYLKSRSSDSFTAALKDFIAPADVDLDNCGKVIIRKQTDPHGAAGQFAFTDDVVTDPARTTGFSLADDGVEEIPNVLQGSYTVTESDLPAGFDLVDIDCSASTGVTATVDVTAGTASFTIDDVADVADCTFTNRARAELTVVKSTPDGSGTFSFTSGTLTPAAFDLTTTAAGDTDSRDFDDLAPGTYDVAETVPAGWNLQSATCDNGDAPSAVTLDAGDDVTCTFVDVVERGALKIVKTRKHAAAGPGDHPHANVSFAITGSDLPAGTTRVTNAAGVTCIDGLRYGDYDVVETVPAGYRAVDPDQTATVDTESVCGDGNEATLTFENVPLTDLTVTVDSQVDGGTASTIDCTPLDAAGDDATTGPNGDGSLGIDDLDPGTYTCEVVIDP